MHPCGRAKHGVRVAVPPPHRVARNGAAAHPHGRAEHKARAAVPLSPAGGVQRRGGPQHCRPPSRRRNSTASVPQAIVPCCPLPTSRLLHDSSEAAKHKYSSAGAIRPLYLARA